MNDRIFEQRHQTLMDTAGPNVETELRHLERTALLLAPVEAMAQELIDAAEHVIEVAS